ncbi:MAG: amidohydrolase family protein, partial [Actinomycetota bacterium]
RAALERFAAEGLLDEADEVVASAGGSAWFDRVEAVLRPEIGRPVRLVLRSGCTVTHDEGLYRRLSPFERGRIGDGALVPALEAWAAVLSQPEPGLAILGMGKRDVPFDIDLPLPRWAFEGGTDATIARLRDPDLRERLRVELEEEGTDGFHGVPVDWSWIVVGGTGDEANGWAVGRSIADLAGERGERPVDLFCALAADDRLMATALHHVGNEEHVRLFMRHPAHTAGSDGILVGSRPHPRGWGTMPRYLAHYVRELGVLGLEEAVRHMTSAPAQRLGLWDRGLVRPGMVADLVAFDPERVRDTATYEDPRQAPEGIPHVWVAGSATVRDGARTEALPGRALRSRFGA